MRKKIMAEARSWLRTPYQHQARLKGVGVDCVGLIIGVGVNLGLTSEDAIRITGYARTPNPNHMLSYIKKYLEPVEPSAVGIGDIAWVQWRKGLPMHMGIVGRYNGNRTIIHALSTVKMVTEHTLTPEWERRVKSYWRFPGVT